MTPLDRAVTLVRDVGVDRSRRALTDAIRAHRTAQQGVDEARRALAQVLQALLDAPPPGEARDGGDLGRRVANRARLNERIAEARRRVERACAAEAVAARERQHQAVRWGRADTARTQWRKSLERQRAASAQLRDARDEEAIADDRGVIARFGSRQSR